jgi:hypothetical protein
MPKNADWLPTRREFQLAMAQSWPRVMRDHAAPWRIPEADITELQGLIDDAAAALARANSADRTVVITVQCKKAFEKLTAAMRVIKSHYFLSPPLRDANYSALGLKPKDPTPTPTPPPISQAEADITRPGIHLLELHPRPVSGFPPDPHQANHGCRIYWGVMPPGGATVEAATGSKRELIRAPVSGEELPHSRFTRRKKERFDFSAEDSGKTVYFCIRYENAKGEPGPWGPMFSSVIP